MSRAQHFRVTNNSDDKSISKPNKPFYHNNINSDQAIAILKAKQETANLEAKQQQIKAPNKFFLATRIGASLQIFLSQGLEDIIIHKDISKPIKYKLISDTKVKGVFSIPGLEREIEEELTSVYAYFEKCGFQCVDEKDPILQSVLAGNNKSFNSELKAPAIRHQLRIHTPPREAPKQPSNNNSVSATQTRQEVKSGGGVSLLFNTQNQSASEANPGSSSSTNSGATSSSSTTTVFHN